MPEARDDQPSAAITVISTSTFGPQAGNLDAGSLRTATGRNEGLPGGVHLGFLPDVGDVDGRGEQAREVGADLAQLASIWVSASVVCSRKLRADGAAAATVQTNPPCTTARLRYGLAPGMRSMSDFCMAAWLPGTFRWVNRGRGQNSRSTSRSVVPV